MEKKDIILKILDGLYQNSKLPSKEELELDLEHYGEILEIIMHSNLAFDIKITKAGQGNKVQMIWGDNAKITITGIEYLKQNKK